MVRCGRGSQGAAALQLPVPVPYATHVGCAWIRVALGGSPGSLAGDTDACGLCLLAAGVG
jgi:hypothetical protein